MKLLLDGGGPIDLAGAPSGDTALMAAATAGQVDMVKLLVKRGAATHFTNTAGDTAHDLADALALGKKLTGQLAPKLPKIPAPMTAASPATQHTEDVEVEEEEETFGGFEG